GGAGARVPGSGGFAAASRTFGVGADVVCAGVLVVAARTGAGCLGFAAMSVLAARTAGCSFSGGAAVSDEPLNQLPIKLAIVVGFCSGAAASPCFACGADRGTGTFATATGLLAAAADSCVRTGAATAAGLGSRGSAPGAVSKRGGVPGAVLATWNT